MVHAHLSLSRPSLLSFVRAYLWQLERTGALLAVTEAEQRAAQEAAEALYAAASDRDQRSRPQFGQPIPDLSHRKRREVVRADRSLFVEPSGTDRNHTIALPGIGQAHQRLMVLFRL